MAKPRTSFVCRDCGSVHPRWLGKCPDCSAWDTLESFTEAKLPASAPAPSGTWVAPGTKARGSGARRINEINDLDVSRQSTGISEFDRVLGGGIVPGSAVLLGGEPGVGKSTLILQAAAMLAARGVCVLYASSEESPQQLRMRFDRLIGDRAEKASENLYVCTETDLGRIAKEVQSVNPEIVLLDSIQMVYSPNVDAPPGSTTQLRRSCHELVQMAKTANRAVILVGHVTKDGNLAGPKVLEHLVDVVLSIEGDRHDGHRVLRAVKNRFGSTHEIGLFEMTATGLHELESAGASIEPNGPTLSGSVLTATMAGSRCLPAEIQGLTATGFLGSPSRKATGLDSNRLAMLIAVLEKHGGVRLADQNVFAAATGGLRIVEPAADLAVALAVSGAFRGQGVSPGTVVLGEVGLTGAIRNVHQLEKRLRELARRGAVRAIIPAKQMKVLKGIPIEGIGVSTVGEAVAQLENCGEIRLKQESQELLNGPSAGRMGGNH